MKPFTTLVVILFLIVALIHVWRLFDPFTVVIGSYTVPVGGSALAVFVALTLAWGVWRESRRRS